MVGVAFAVGGVLGHNLIDRKAQHSIQLAGDLKQQFESVREDNSELKRMLAILESSNKVDRIALGDVQNELARLQELLAKSRKELDFYRRIVSPNNVDKDLYIQDFRIVRDPELKFLLALSQGPGYERFVRGRVHLTIDGDLNGQRIALNMNQLGQPDDFSFKFRHFKLLSGKIRLPRGFSPVSVEVRVIPNSKETKVLKSDWPWDDFDVDQRT